MQDMQSSEMAECLSKIGKQLCGIDIDDLSPSEQQIGKILVKAGVLKTITMKAGKPPIDYHWLEYELAGSD